jgi:uncharacterized protein (TIGR03435 family)
MSSCAQLGVVLAYFVVGACGFGGSAAGQSFDVASAEISQHVPQQGPVGYRFSVSPDSVTAHRAPLGSCIRWAYGFHQSQRFWLVGPSWMEPGFDCVRYDIVAKTAAPVTFAQLRLMMRNLLAERWKLVVHQESRVIPVYVLSVGKLGPNLQVSKKVSDSDPVVGHDGTTFIGATMWQLVEEIGLQVAAPIVDDTGLTGRYDFTVEDFAKYEEYGIPIAGSTAADFGPAYDQALHKLGLQLKLQKRPTNVLVVDHVEKVPTQN